MTAVSVRDLWVRYGKRDALIGCGFEVAPGKITALLGHNGAGKSSLMSVLCTLRRPDRGQVTVFGADTVREAVAVRANLGVVFQEPSLDRELSVLRNLRLHARMYGMGRTAAARRIEEVLAMFGLTGRADSTVESLSGGLARRVELARAVLHSPRLLALDEPTIGLDPESRLMFWRDLTTLREQTGLTVLYSTHYMDEADNADTVIILRDGRVSSAGKPAELKQRLGRSSLLLLTDNDELAEQSLSAAGFSVSRLGTGVVVSAADPSSLVGAVVRACPANIVSLTVRSPSMDDVFLSAPAEPGLVDSR